VTLKAELKTVAYKEISKLCKLCKLFIMKMVALI